MEEACGQLEAAISEGDEKQVASILAEQPDILSRFSHYHSNELSPLHVALNKVCHLHAVMCRHSFSAILLF